MIAAILVEAPFDRPRGQFQGALPEAGLQRLAIDRLGGPGSYEAGELVFDGGDELLRARLFLGAPRVSPPVYCQRASASCSLA